MQNKLKVFSMALLLGGAMLLGSCDTVKAELPSAIQNEAILTTNTKIYNNEMEKLYEKVVPGDSSSADKVLNILLEKLAAGKFGSFYGEAGLRAAVKDEAKMTAFLAAHSEMFASAQEVEDFYALIEDSIAKTFFSNVTNSTYQDRHLFDEKKFYDAQEEALYDLLDSYATVLKTKAPTLVDGHKDYRDVRDYFGNADNDYLDVYQDYITRALLPDAYRRALVTKYIINKNYGTIGRSYVRKVQYIALKDISEDASAVSNLTSAYASIILNNDKEGIVSEVKTITGTDITLTDEEVLTLRDFSFLDKVYLGTVNKLLFGADEDFETIARAIYNKAGYDRSKFEWTEGGETTSVYSWTNFGKTLKNYSEISLDRNIDGTSVDEFTGSKAYTKETGLLLKNRAVVGENNTKEGWFTSNDLSELPSEAKKRLFKIQVANEVDNNYIVSGDTVTVNPNQQMRYGWYRQGSYYLVEGAYGEANQTPYVLSGDGTTYIVRVLEAVKSSKVSLADNALNYEKLVEMGVRTADQPTLDQITLDVADLLSSTDSYKKAARQDYIKNAEINYHDQSVYDYFKTTFPDLFE